MVLLGRKPPSLQTLFYQPFSQKQQEVAIQTDGNANQEARNNGCHPTVSKRRPLRCEIRANATKKEIIAITISISNRFHRQK
jgi:hypothetical protein